MAFFSKLKERLFNSSSKLEEGLDAIVEDGGEEDAAPEAPPEAAPRTAPAPEPAAPGWPVRIRLSNHSWEGTTVRTSGSSSSINCAMPAW